MYNISIYLNMFKVFHREFMYTKHKIKLTEKLISDFENIYYKTKYD